MADSDWVLNEPLVVLGSVDGPYLLTGQGRLGGHELTCHYAPASEQPIDFRVFLDGERIFTLGEASPAGAWFRFCRESGYDPERHLDLDPALILFRQALPRLARDWREHGLPYGALGVPEGVVCLATVQAAWSQAAGQLEDLARGDRAREQVAASLRAAPLRAVVFHDDPGHREDYVGTGLDEPLLGVYLRLGNGLSLAKATVNGTGGLRWSPWTAGGGWREAGREWGPTLDVGDFLAAAGIGEPASEVVEAFAAALAVLATGLDQAVEAYRDAYPGGVTWHRDPTTRYVDHVIKAVRMRAGRAYLVLDDGSEVEVVADRSASVVEVGDAPRPA